MDTTTASVSTLNELVLINNDRVAGYEKALEELKSKSEGSVGNEDLTALFMGYAADSRRMSTELADQVRSEGGEAEEGTMVSGKLFRAWMDVKALFTGKDRHAILASCETGEDAAQRAYQSALGEDELTPSAREIIVRQQADLKRAHDLVRDLRDASGQ
ncbi:MAG: PA2169 family four-helix-bundle protein [Rhizobacter sp.]|nr:PA2169 family four-helix-bundle protein [Ferruginibacter sp.]